MAMSVSARRLLSEDLSAREAGGEGGDPRVSAGRVRWAVASQSARRLCTKHHLTSPLLRNGSLPLPRFAAERTLESLILISARRRLSEALSAREAGGEGGDPRVSAGRVRWVLASRPAHRLCTKHHLTSPLLRNGSLPLPRFAAERTLESLILISARRRLSEALSAREAGGEGGDPRVSAGRVRWVFASRPAHRLCTKHHLTSPLLRNGSLPLPRFAAERTLESLVRVPSC